MRKTPCYVFDADLLERRIREVRRALPGLPLTFSVKANAFLTDAAAALTDHVEVCSPGELALCRKRGVPPEKIIYSGVVKEAEDIREAITLGAGLLTAESPRQARLIQESAADTGRRVPVLLRLSSGNQFGMSREDLAEILSRPENYPALRLAGLHYYSGTQKKKPDGVRRDLDHLQAVLDALRTCCGFVPELVEYGPGLAADYFGPDPEQTDLALLAAAAKEILSFPAPLGIEMGRFLAAPCGTYHTRVMDLKTVDGVRYALLDGGIHHLKYYGQMMALNAPPLRQEPLRDGEPEAFCLCGSLCTTADVLVREARLAPLHIGDELIFGRCGAYSVTEASALFLSRDLPAVWLRRGGGESLLRPAVPSWPINTPEPAEP